MSKDKSFHDYLLDDVFRQIEGITSKPMFGGYGFYRDGIIFAIIADGKLYFKVGESNRKDYEEHGSRPFTYAMKNGKKTTLSYWELPVDIMEDGDELEKWIDKSVEESRKKDK